MNQFLIVELEGDRRVMSIYAGNKGVKASLRDKDLSALAVIMVDILDIALKGVRADTPKGALKGK